MIQRELGNTNNQTNNVERKNEPVILNSKHDAFVRIVPLGKDRWFSYDYRQIFVNYTRKDDKSRNVPVFFPGPNDDKFNPNDDELYTFLRKVISANFNYRKEHQDFKGDLIKLQDGKYNANIQNRHEVVAIKVNEDGQMEKDANGYPVFRGLQLSNTAYQSLLNKMSKGGFHWKGQKFPTALGFVDSHASYPVQFHYNGNGAGYDVQVRADLPIAEALPDDYLDTDDSGNFIHIDNPELFEGYTKETSPSFYNRVLDQVKESVAKQTEMLKEGNPYEEDATSSQGFTPKDSEGTVDNSQPSVPNPFDDNNTVAQTTKDSTDDPFPAPSDLDDNSDSATGTNTKDPVTPQATDDTINVEQDADDILKNLGL